MTQQQFLRRDWQHWRGASLLSAYRVIGHLALDALASRLGTQFSSNRALGGLVAQANVTIGENSVDLTLLKPKALMNISGPLVSKALKQTAKKPSSMIVIYDSLSHKPYALSPSFGTSAAGHNGIKSIITSLGGDLGFHRFRLGIGKNDRDAAEYVLSKLSQDEINYWGPNGKGSDVAYPFCSHFATSYGHEPPLARYILVRPSGH
ncbi:Peptidyl-tRNA hydrolase superfamily protein [Abortiporus biennis]